MKVRLSCTCFGNFQSCKRYNQTQLQHQLHIFVWHMKISIRREEWPVNFLITDLFKWTLNLLSKGYHPHSLLWGFPQILSPLILLEYYLVKNGFLQVQQWLTDIMLGLYFRSGEILFTDAVYLFLSYPITFSPYQVTLLFGNDHNLYFHKTPWLCIWGSLYSVVILFYKWQAYWTVGQIYSSALIFLVLFGSPVGKYQMYSFTFIKNKRWTAFIEKSFPVAKLVEAQGKAKDHTCDHLDFKETVGHWTIKA